MSLADADPDHLLFVYGTLLPGEERWAILQPFVVGTGTPDAVPGTLYDTGEGYPAASFDGPAAAATGRVAGRVFRVVADRLAEALEVLDEVEDTALGLYRRVRVVTVAGLEVWTYEYGSGLAVTPIAGGDWLSHPR